MAKGLYHYIAQAWKKPDKETMHGRLIAWRAGESIVTLDKPLRLDRARAVGYKDKKGYVVLRVRVMRGGRKRSRHTHGRKSRKQHVKLILKMNYQWVAEGRASKAFTNLEVLNSYKLAKDGKYYYYEVIMVDPNMPEIKSDRTINWICNPASRGRAERGLTSAAKKSRGLRSKSHFMKVRPSARAWKRRGK